MEKLKDKVLACFYCEILSITLFKLLVAAYGKPPVIVPFRKP
jgi:hypothetical protein